MTGSNDIDSRNASLNERRGLLRHLPNSISVLRLLFVLPIAIAIIEMQYVLSFTLFAIAGASDGLDGYLARKFGWVSSFGKIIDPLADKSLLLVISATLAILGHLPFMVLVLMLVKDLAIIGGVLVYTVLAAFPRIQPILLGKVTTVLQILLIGYIMLALCLPEFTGLAAFTHFFIWLMVMVTILDGSVYLWLWTNKLAHDQRWKNMTQPAE